MLHVGFYVQSVIPGFKLALYLPPSTLLIVCDDWRSSASYLRTVVGFAHWGDILQYRWEGFFWYGMLVREGDYPMKGSLAEALLWSDWCIDRCSIYNLTNSWTNNIVAGKVVQTVFGHYNVATCISRSECNVSQDCYIVTGSKDCTVMVWHWSTKQQSVLGDNGSKFRSVSIFTISAPNSATSKLLFLVATKR